MYETLPPPSNDRKVVKMMLDVIILLGYYMFIETSSPRRPNDNATISRQVSLSGNACLYFYYHMNGADVGTLNVRLGGRQVFMKEGSQGNGWMKAEVRLSDSGSAEVR